MKPLYQVSGYDDVKDSREYHRPSRGRTYLRH